MCWCMFQPYPKLLEVFEVRNISIGGSRSHVGYCAHMHWFCFCLHAVWNRSPLRLTFGFTSIGSSRSLAFILVFRESTCKVPLVNFPLSLQLFESKLSPYVHACSQVLLTYCLSSCIYLGFLGVYLQRAILYGGIYTLSLGRHCHFDRWDVTLLYIIASTVGTSMPNFYYWTILQFVLLLQSLSNHLLQPFVYYPSYGYTLVYTHALGTCYDTGFPREGQIHA